ncbi:hypothetical protein J4E81_010623 [Alternaria sp. BMP 2799]|nr:hypothetical protein J4E81_010623 [Alternaria sp. BMP 2799]
MVAVSDGRKITVDSRTFQRDDKKPQHERDFQATLQHGTSIRLGDLTYVLVYTDLSQEQKQRELEEALAQVNAMPPNSVMLLSPTPSKPTIDYHGYSIYDANHHGATSSVSLGFDKSNGKPVVVKMVKCTASQFGDLRREIGILSRIRHENVCKLLEVVNWDASANPHEWRQNECLTVGLIMSPPATSSALQLLPTWKRLPESTTFLRESIRQIGSGLAHIHSLNILHRDIKPENIGYRSESPVHVIILDFGCSDLGPHSTRHNRGTITYLAPEVMRIKEEVSPDPFSFPSDVWSLGVTLVDFLMGKQVHRKLGQAPVYKSFRDILDATAARVDYREFWDIAVELLAWEAELRPTAEQLAQRFSHEKQNESEVSRQPSQSEEPLAKRGKV